MSKILEISEYIHSKLSLNDRDCFINHENQIIIHTEPAYLRSVLTLLKSDDKCKFSILTDIFAADFPEREKRFEIVYNLLSSFYNVRLMVKVFVDENQSVPAMSEIYIGAGWFEREVYDMYGVIFTAHLDLRRILTDYGFEGHPLRKDFPLSGHVEVKYDDTIKKVVYEPVNLPQEYRHFDNLSDWVGTNYVLPGDEKAGGSK
jgi:NADH-quinone oxidoreductase subunit C